MSLFLSLVAMVLLHAVQQTILSNSGSTKSDWISAISHTATNHHNLLQVVHVIDAQVAVVVGEIESRKIFRKWKFSDKEAYKVAGKLIQCVEDNSL